MEGCPSSAQKMEPFRSSRTPPPTLDHLFILESNHPSLVVQQIPMNYIIKIGQSILLLSFIPIVSWRYFLIPNIVSILLSYSVELPFRKTAEQGSAALQD